MHRCLKLFVFGENERVLVLTDTNLAGNPSRSLTAPKEYIIDLHTFYKAASSLTLRLFAKRFYVLSDFVFLFYIIFSILLGLLIKSAIDYKVRHTSIRSSFCDDCKQTNKLSQIALLASFLSLSFSINLTNAL